MEDITNFSDEYGAVKYESACVICGKGKKSSELRVKGLKTVIECSLKRNDGLHFRVTVDGKNSIHENCRKHYIDIRKILNKSIKTNEN